MDLRQDPMAQRLTRAVDAALAGTRGADVELADIGVPALSLPDDIGGYELGLGADVAVNGRLGYQLEPAPAYRETVLAVELLPAEEITEPMREGLLTGEAHAVAVGLHEPCPLHVDASGRLWGESEAVAAARYAVVVARAASSSADAAWIRLDPEQPQVRTVEDTRLDEPHVRFVFDGAVADEVLVPDAVAHRALDRARIRQAALLLGMAGRALETARAHVNRRVQYGDALVKLQTVAHRLSRLIGLGDGWQLTLNETAWHHDCGSARPGDAALALAVATDHALECTRLGIQLHGVRGMLAASTPAAAYRAASIAATRLGSPQSAWLEAGHA